MVGSHEVEEAENRYVGAMDHVVVVSVDYRMWVSVLDTSNPPLKIIAGLRSSSTHMQSMTLSMF